MFEYEEIREFWKIVRRLDWKELCVYDKPYEEGKKILKDELKLSDKKLGLLWKICRYHYDMLKNRVYGYYLAKTDGKNHWLAPDEFDGGIQPSDDSMYDLLCHIIGLGENAYKDALEHPDRIWKLGKDYRENFGYCFS